MGFGGFVFGWVVGAGGTVVVGPGAPGVDLEEGEVLGVFGGGVA